jgi:hypothetical protein
MTDHKCYSNGKGRCAVCGGIEPPPWPVESRDTYGSTVAERDVPEPVAPIPAQERGSAARSGSSVGDSPREGSNGPRAVQESLLAACPKCGSSWRNVKTTGMNCEDEWHDS